MTEPVNPDHESARPEPDRPTTGPQPSIPQPGERSALKKLAHRMRHVYKTRVRTTTVVLVIAFIALSVFYGFSSSHYNPETPTQTVRSTQQTVEPTTQEPIPTSEVPLTSEPPVSTSEPQQQTEESTSTSESTQPLFPNPFEQTPESSRQSVAPTATPGTSPGR